uniref:phospholipase D n=1 Tax=Lepeophtheirus salmonis TaxID=72036 RepID=A0A0K2T5Y1_LEPSM
MGKKLSCCCKSEKDDLEDDLEDHKKPFLHGLLTVNIIEASGLPDTDTTFFNIDRKDKTDAYVSGSLGESTIFKTKYVPNSLNPRWNENFSILVCHHASSLRIDLKDKEHIGAVLVASTFIRIQDLIDQGVISGWFDLMNSNNNGGSLHMSITYMPKETLNEESKGVQESYFLPRSGNRVTLYQDADTPLLPVFNGLMDCAGEQEYIPPRAWIDVYKAIRDAQKFIYITGWSVATSIKLVRDNDKIDPDGDSNVGELLKRKADEGVKVLILIWNEKLSSEENPGLMGTHDEETRLYFEDTAVKCLAVARVKFESLLASEFVSSCYTHHQKTIICDADPINDAEKRRIIAFVGGLDITDGRYDSPEFPLYNTICGPKNCDDFYNNCITGVSKELGPREPWHDCHAKVEGPGALDVMKNFEERWRRQADYHIHDLYHIEDDAIDRDTECEVPKSEGGSWTVQLFRSITSDACVFDFEGQKYLHSKGGRLVENSILRNMVIQIRLAKRFLYFENQYFIGSSYAWLNDRKTLSPHVIPCEITEKIIENIREGKEFKAYILIPMFPEGIPTSDATQEILFWQYRTMQMMYRRIALAIQEDGQRKSHPTDYLNFYCLGKRESTEGFPCEFFSDPDPGTEPELVRNSMRHSIYVHSKMTIVDDDYVLVGSANINQRSLGGNRDSEIAIGAFQPDHINDDSPRGGVHKYRMALWSAHLGGYDEAYLNPQSSECLEKVREVTSSFWELYTKDDPEFSDVHMLPYPISVSEEGEVEALEEPWNCFPDTTAKVLGAKSGYLPAKLTT